MASADAAQRVRLRIIDWLATQGHGGKAKLAAAVSAKYGASKSRSWATSIQKTPENKGQDVRLKDLDAIADLLGIPPGELVSDFDHVYLELTMAESRLLRYYRMLPDTVRAHWMHWLDYLFRFPAEALKQQGKERERRTLDARRRESLGARMRPDKDSRRA